MAFSRFDPNEFARYAYSLTASDHSEVALRTAVGRLYYSAFLLALYQFYPSGKVPKQRFKSQPESRRAIHATVIDDLIRKSTSLGTQLDTLKELRTQADYKLVPNSGYQNWLSNWQQAMNIAKNLLPRLSRI